MILLQLLLAIVLGPILLFSPIALLIGVCAIIGVLQNIAETLLTDPHTRP